MQSAQRDEEEPGNQPGWKRECEAGRTLVEQCEASRTLVEVLTDDQLMLEVIDKGAGSREHPVPLLFVHGGWHSASCWHNFLDFFADAGYRAVALSLRGHGASPTAKRFHACSIADYVDDVGAAANRLGGRPVLIAHSLGGFVVQRYLENRDAPAAVLVASVPPQGVLGLAMRIWSRHPWISLRSLPVGNLTGFIGTPALVREHLFCTHTPDDIVESCAAGVQSEALRASLIDPLIRRVKSKRVSTPMLVLGAAQDGMVTSAEVRATARAYQTEAEFFPGMGHNMMLEPGWAEVAERIHAWLQTRDLA